MLGPARPGRRQPWPPPPRLHPREPVTDHPTSLPDLAGALAGARLSGAPDTGVRVSDVTHDSRAAGPGVLVACRPGARVDGHAFAPQAVAAGTPALLVERVLDSPVPQVVVADVAAALGPAAALVHGDPSRDLTLLGVTGTNGKTTTTFLLEAALRAAGARTGLVGTIRTQVADEVVEGVRTTPEASDLQRLLHRMVDAGVSAAAMEVSSHGLALGRVTGTRFTAAAFTNLSQDHLDFHADLAAYEAAKTELFTPGYTDIAVVDVDGAAGERIARAASREGLRVVRVSTRSRRGGQADAWAGDIALGPSGSTFTAHVGPDLAPLRVRLRLPGAFNVANALLALATASAAGVDPGAAAAGIADLAGVPGRMEALDEGQPFGVVVDYAHTPDSVDNVLRAARELTAGRVIVVLGCGGDRDQGKRPQMGRAAAALADLAVFTDDNPRGEDPQAILDAIAAGAATVAGARWLVVADRRAAIAEALNAAEPGDVVVIAGKGHEPYQEIAGRREPFDDRAVARELLAGHDLAAPQRLMGGHP